MLDKQNEKVFTMPPEPLYAKPSHHLTKEIQRLAYVMLPNNGQLP